MIRLSAIVTIAHPWMLEVQRIEVPFIWKHAVPKRPT
jgi:hypothetical protein